MQLNRKDLKLVFVNKIGKNSDDKFEYELYYSYTPEVVWAEDFAEQVPSICSIDDLIPDASTYHAIIRATSYTEFKLAQENSCFSMQDCIDGIIKLIWIHDNDGYYYGLDFGTDIDTADEFFSGYGVEMTELVYTNTDVGNEDKDAYNGEIENTDISEEDNNNDEEDLEKIFNGEV
jgi:hypothetical protein